ncbi:uncharacterized protein LOC135687920, partial [Rhopilema esculentum]|uniref:uncharacterized protein LOC135687920 n=1 Tax=Rhopilema esculentum TaxID=499914 RepID=UPI0031E3EF7C
MQDQISIEEQVSKFWTLESFGILKNELSVYEDFEDEIEFSEGRYQVKLPWKKDHPTLPDNFELCQKRLIGLYSKLKKNRKLLNDYDSIINDQEKRGIIERVDSHFVGGVGKTHYIPHHPVIREDKETTKVRLVYDASAKDKTGVSLNQCLYPGPCLLKTVAEIIARFRLNPIALTSDIEKAFHMVSVHPSDRDVLRFLWVDSLDDEQPKIITYRFSRVVFGITCSPFLLNATLKKHIESYSTDYPEVCNKLLNSLYADDVNSGGHSIEEVLNLYEISKNLMLEGGFRLRKWQSNSKEVRDKIEDFESNSSECIENILPTTEENQSFAKSSLSMEEIDNKSKCVKVLGLNWDLEEDAFEFKLSELAKFAAELIPTKRNVLRLVAKVFDPQGFISPVTTPLKVFLQKLFKAKLSWDETLPEALDKEWKFLISKLDKVESIFVPRYYFGSIDGKPDLVELFGFCDSSESAYVAS